MATTRSSSLIPPTVLPVEIRDKIRSQPECQLLWAVLEEAIGTYVKYANATNRRGQRLFHEAEDWIFQDNYHWLCSFINICHILDVEPDYLRAGLMHWREDQQASAKHEAA